MVGDGIPIEVARLEAFVGDWMVTGTLESEGTTSIVSGRWRFERAADGWGVRGRMLTEIESMGAFEEDELIGFDRPDGEVHLFSMNQFAVRDHRGGWSSDDTLRVEFAGLQDGRRITEVITVRFVTPTDLAG